MPPRDRETFEAAELAVVLSYYDLGVIESLTEFPRGSRRSPKVGIVCDRGKFLLKRRAPRRSHPDRVRFSHRVQLHLASVGFPVARLVSTRDRPQTYINLKDRIYELFEFIPGQPYERTAEEAQDAGEVLARFHDAMDAFDTPASLPPPLGDFHDASAVRTALYSSAPRLSMHDSFVGTESDLADLVRSLMEAYDTSATRINSLGFESWPMRIIHSDWHPGNILFKRRKVAAVLDYDSVRSSRAAVEVANGALQFSIMAGGDPATWAAEIDGKRYRAFVEGYESLHALSGAECESLPHLMIEALIAECVHPIAETGSVGRWGGYRVLQMVRRKVSWLEANAETLASAASDRGRG